MSDTALAETRSSIAAKQAEYLTIKPTAWASLVGGRVFHVSLNPVAAEKYCQEICDVGQAYSVKPLYLAPIPVLSSLANENAELRAELERVQRGTA